MMMSMLVIAMAAALIGGATMAWFTDEAASEEVSFQAGTLLIDIDDLERTGDYTEVDIDNLNPGDTWEWEFDVENVGTKNFDWGIYVCWEDITGQNNPNLDEDMRALLQENGYGDGELSEVIKWTVETDRDVGSVSDGILPAAGGPAGVVADDTFAPGDDPVTFTVTAKLPEEADNAYQGGMMRLAFGVEAWQDDDRVDPPEIGDLECLLGEMVTTQSELEDALSDSSIDKIVLGGEFDGFRLERGVTLVGGTINSADISGEPRDTGIYLATEEDVNINNVTFDGQNISLAQGILSVTGNSTNVNVSNSTFKDLHMGVYFNPGVSGTINNNTFENINHCAIGIDSDAGVDITNNSITDASVGLEIFKANVTYSGNTFDNVDTEVDDQS